MRPPPHEATAFASGMPKPSTRRAIEATSAPRWRASGGSSADRSPAQRARLRPDAAGMRSLGQRACDGHGFLAGCLPEPDLDGKASEGTAGHLGEQIVRASAKPPSPAQGMREIGREPAELELRQARLDRGRERKRQFGNIVVHGHRSPKAKAARPSFAAPRFSHMAWRTAKTAPATRIRRRRRRG